LSAAWPNVRLRDVLARSEHTIRLDPEATYTEVTVRINGKGVVERRRVQGTEIAADRRYTVRTGQFIISRIDARHGASGIIPPELDGAIVTNDFPVFDIREDSLSPKFLDWLSKTASFVELCKRASEGTTNRVRLSEERLKLLEIPLPPLDEQHQIVACIEEMAAQIVEAQKLRSASIREVDALRASSSARIFGKLLGGETRPLADVVTLERGKFSHRPRNEPRFFGGDHPWIQIAEIEASNKYIRDWSVTLNDDGLAISKKFPSGTLLISIAATIGAVGILAFDCCVPDSIVGITPPKHVSPEFMYHYLSFLRTHLEAVAPQSAQKNINLQILGSLPFPVLGHDEQLTVVAQLDALQAKVDALRGLQVETTAELNAILPAILDKAFRGELA
jgi:type I restriction enzyme S subunit